MTPKAVDPSDSVDEDDEQEDAGSEDLGPPAPELEITPKEFQVRLHKRVEAQKDFVDGEGQNNRSKWRDLLRLLRDTIPVEPPDVHVFKLRANSIDNCLWEGNSLSKRYPLGVALVPTPVREEKPGQIARFPDAVVARMFPPPNGFEAIAVCTPSKKDGFSVDAIVSERNSAVGAKLAGLYPAAREYSAEKPSSSAPTVRTSTSYEASSDLVASIASHLKESLNVILQGPPGTGKSFLSTETLAFLGQVSRAQLDAYRYERARAASGTLKDLLSGADAGTLIWERIQLHPNYAYDDLVRGMAATHEDGHMQFAPSDKLLVELSLLARARPKSTVVLVLDEVNRCSLASVLGELVFAIEPSARGIPVRLQYPKPPNGLSQDGLAIPPNLYLLGTMNTADRSIGLVDFAIRRRFRFLDVLPNPVVIRQQFKVKARAEKGIALYEATNDCVQDRNLRIGHSFFLLERPDDGDWNARLADRFSFEVIPQLREYLSEGRAVKQLFTIGSISIDLRAASPLADATARKKLAVFLNS